MENKQFIAKTAKSLSIEAKEVAQAAQTLFEIMTEQLAEGNAIAIPSFGTFEICKHEERIDIDLSTGSRMLFPPYIETVFKPGNILKKRVIENSEQ